MEEKTDKDKYTLRNCFKVIERILGKELKGKELFTKIKTK